jgi:hypothetical protein
LPSAADRVDSTLDTSDNPTPKLSIMFSAIKVTGEPVSIIISSLMLFISTGAYKL